MVEKIRKILLNIDGINGWKINEKTVESNELFFIRKSYEQGQDVTHISLTLYKDFEENGKKYRGSATISLPYHG